MTLLKQYVKKVEAHLKTLSLEELLKAVYEYSNPDDYDGGWTNEGDFLKDTSRNILETRLIKAGLLEDYIKEEYS